MRISDWSSDVCSSDLGAFSWVGLFEPTFDEINACADAFGLHPLAVDDALHAHQLPKLEIYGDQLIIVADRKSVVYGKRVSVRVALGGCRIINKQICTRHKSSPLSHIITPINQT